MALTTPRDLTLEAFLRLPEEEPALEYEPGGTITQKESPRGRHRALQGELLRRLDDAGVRSHTARAFVELRFTAAGASYVPEVSLYRWERIPRRADGSLADVFNSPPDLAAGVLSPGQSTVGVMLRCLWYVANGVQVALLVDPDDRTIVVFRPGGEPRMLRGDMALDLPGLLPGFRLSAEDLFTALRLD